MKLRRGGTDIALPMHNLCVRRCANATPLSLSRERNSVLIFEMDGWDLGAVWTGVECLVPTRIRPPDSPAPIESLYRLSYPDCQYLYVLVRNVESDVSAFCYGYTHIYLFIYLFIHLFIYPFIYLFIHLFICLLIYLFIYLYIHLVIYLFFCLFIYLFICSFIYLFIYSFIY